MTGSMVLMNESFSLENVLPGVHSLIDSKIGENGSWTSRNTRATVNINFKTLVVDHIV